MADTGFVIAGAGASIDTGSAAGWSIPSRITADDGSTSNVTLSGSTPVSDTLRASLFGLEVPDGATIDGVEVRIARRTVTGDPPVDNRIQLDRGTSGTGEGDNKASETWPGSTITATDYGGAADTWGLSLTPEDVNDDDFSVLVQAEAGGGTGIAGVDYIAIRVHYTEDGGGDEGEGIEAAQGEYALTGNAAGLLWHRVLAAGQGEYVVTGNAGTIAKAIHLEAAQGSYAITGTAADLLWHHVLEAVQGSYDLTGLQAALITGERIAADQGVYVLTGNEVNTLWNRVLAAQTGQYAITGNAAALRHNRRLVADDGAYALTGQQAGLLVGRMLLAAQGSYSVSGIAAGLLVGHRLDAAQGSYAIAGQEATLLRTAAGGRLEAETGMYVLAGQTATLRSPTAGRGKFGFMKFGGMGRR